MKSLKTQQENHTESTADECTSDDLDSQEITNIREVQTLEFFPPLGLVFDLDQYLVQVACSQCHM